LLDFLFGIHDKRTIRNNCFLPIGSTGHANAPYAECLRRQTLPLVAPPVRAHVGRRSGDMCPEDFEGLTLIKAFCFIRR